MHNINKICIMASTCAICQQAAHITYQHLLVLAAQQEPCKKSQSDLSE